MFFCILAYSKHIIFSWKSHIFWVIGDFYVFFHVIFGEFLVGTGEPPILRWSIWKKVWIGQTLGPKSQLLPKICFGGFPKSHDSSSDCLKPKFKSFSKIAVKSPGPDLHHFFACLGLHPQILIWDQWVTHNLKVFVRCVLCFVLIFCS